MQRVRILLADDHRMLCAAFQKLLEPKYEVVGSVGDGRALLQAAVELKPDVVILDIGMPLLNGLDAGREMKKLLPHAKLIFLTMNADAELAAEAFRIGASAYLLKTSDATELPRAISDALKGISYITPQIRQAMDERLIRHPDAATRPRQLTDRQREVINLGVGRTRDGQYLFIEAGSHTTNEYRFLSTANPSGEFRIIAPRLDDQEYYPSHRNGLFYIRVNDTGKNFRIVTAPTSAPGRDHWTELIPLDPAHPLEDFDLFETFAVTTRRKLGLPTLEVLRFTTLGDPFVPASSGRVGSESPAPPALSAPIPITFPEPTYTAAPHVNRVFSADSFRYSYTSLVSPPSVYEYNVSRTASETPIGASKLLKQQEVPGGFDPTLYASERIWVDAPDAVSPTGSIPVPVSIVYRRDSFHRDATNPLYVYGYGSYGYPLPVGFSPTRLSLLDRGVVMAYAHIRGGGELGDAWHDAGKMQLKRNTFTDFIAVTESLTAQRYGSTHPRRHRRRLRRRPAHGRRRQHRRHLWKTRPLPRRPVPCPLRRHHEHHARRHSAPHRRRV